MTTSVEARQQRSTRVDAPHNPHHARRWLILVVLGLAQLMVVLDATIVNIALPSAQQALHFDDNARQWVVTGYALAFGSLLLLGGRVADLFGRKQALLVGLLGFAAASAVGGAATNFTMLVVARAAQGLFGALLAPAALSLLTTTFTDPKERGRAFGIYGAIAGGGGAFGLLLGGLLTEYLSWRWCMYINLPIGLAAAAGALVLLHRQAPAHRPRLDLPGTITVSAALFGLVYGFSNAVTHSWSSPLTWGFLVAGGVLLAAFAVIQLRTAHPLLPLRVVLDRNRGGSYLAVFISGAGMFGVFLFLTYYLQQILGYTPVRTGLAFLPMIGMLMVVATLATSMLMPRTGPKPLVAIGMIVAAAGMAWMTGLGLHSSYGTAVLPPLLVTAAGIGLLMAPSMSTATLGVATEDAGVASATVNTAQQIGGSIGTALLNTLASTAAANYLAGRTPTPEAMANAALHSYSTAYWWSAAIFAAGAVVCGLLLRRGVPATADPDAPPTLVH